MQLTLFKFLGLLVYALKMYGLLIIHKCIDAIYNLAISYYYLPIKISVAYLLCYIYFNNLSNTENPR